MIWDLILNYVNALYLLSKPTRLLVRDSMQDHSRARDDDCASCFRARRSSARPGRRRFSRRQLHLQKYQISLKFVAPFSEDEAEGRNFPAMSARVAVPWPSLGASSPRRSLRAPPSPSAAVRTNAPCPHGTASSSPRAPSRDLLMPLNQRRPPGPPAARSRTRLHLIFAEFCRVIRAAVKVWVERLGGLCLNAYAFALL